ncbi:MAG: hypothetical protein QOF11_1995 [Chloroflexota bacterium]|nr:hypothetical protein [Chloroflexota bacterium]
MLSRSMTQATSARAGSIRRMRRRSSASAANGRIFCSTNGCASFLELDPAAGVATCPVCGFRRRLS